MYIQVSALSSAALIAQSIKKAAQRLAKEDGVSLNQRIAAAMAEKIGIIRRKTRNRTLPFLTNALLPKHLAEFVFVISGWRSWLACVPVTGQMPAKAEPLPSFPLILRIRSGSPQVWAGPIGPTSYNPTFTQRSRRSRPSPIQWCSLVGKPF